MKQKKNLLLGVTLAILSNEKKIVIAKIDKKKKKIIDLTTTVKMELKIPKKKLMMTLNHSHMRQSFDNSLRIMFLD